MKTKPGTGNKLPKTLATKQDGFLRFRRFQDRDLLLREKDWPLYRIQRCVAKKPLQDEEDAEDHVMPILEIRKHKDGRVLYAAYREKRQNDWMRWDAHIDTSAVPFNGPSERNADGSEPTPSRPELDHLMNWLGNSLDISSHVFYYALDPELVE